MIPPSEAGETPAAQTATTRSIRPNRVVAPRRRLLGDIPPWALIPAAAGALLILIPVAALVARLDGDGFWAQITSPAARDALWLSLRTSALATVGCILLGVPMALVLARTNLPGRRIARTLILMPLVLPPVVGGIALLAAFGRRGVLGAELAFFGVSLPFTTAAVVLAQTFVALPFMVLTLDGALRSHDSRREEVAQTLGARPGRILWRVTLPQVAPALMSGTVLAFARALGEFGATITFAGSLQGVTQTLPLEIYLSRSSDADAAVALSLVLVVVAFGIIGLAYGGGAKTVGSRGTSRESRLIIRSTPPVKEAPATTAIPATPPVALCVQVRWPERGVDVDLRIEPGTVIALLGPNGVGKSTVLRAIAGLESFRKSDDTHIRVQAGSEVLTDTAAGLDVPARDRRIGWLSQRALLFDSMPVLGNVAFGPRSRGVVRGTARSRGIEQLGRVGVAELAPRAVNTLSGGQAQRVSLARALASEPQILLLDEPFAALDVTAAHHARATLGAQQRREPRTTILVTHDVLDVVVLADRVVVLEEGKVTDDGTPAEVLTRPRSMFAARLAGVNVLVGHASGMDATAASTAAAMSAPTAMVDSGDANSERRTATIMTSDGAVVVGTSPDELAAGERAVAVFEPRAVAIHSTPPAGSPRNVFAVLVTGIEPLGPLLRVWGRLRPDGEHSDSEHSDGATTLAADITAAATTSLDLTPGNQVWFAVKAAEVDVHCR